MGTTFPVCFGLACALQPPPWRKQVEVECRRSAPDADQESDFRWFPLALSPENALTDGSGWPLAKEGRWHRLKAAAYTSTSRRVRRQTNAGTSCERGRTAFSINGSVGFMTSRSKNRDMFRNGNRNHHAMDYRERPKIDRIACPGWWRASGTSWCQYIYMPIVTFF